MAEVKEIDFDPKSRMDRLISCGRIRIDRYLGASYYLQTALDSLNVAEYLLKRGSLETPFIIYVKYINFCRAIYKSKYFLKASINQKSRCSSKLKSVMAKKEALAKKILEVYNYRDSKFLADLKKSKKIQKPPEIVPPQNLSQRLTSFTIIVPKNVPVLITTMTMPNSDKIIAALGAEIQETDLFFVKDMIITSFEDNGEIENFESINDILENNNSVCIGFTQFQKDTSPFITCLNEQILRQFEKNFTGAVAVMVSFLGSIQSYVLTDYSLDMASDSTNNKSNYIRAVEAPYVLFDECYHMNLHDIRTHKAKITPSCFIKL